MLPRIISPIIHNFNSREFFLRLAQEYQQLYIEALYYDQDSNEPEAPLMVLHGKLAQHLKKYPELIKHDGIKNDSKNIFGHMSACAE